MTRLIEEARTLLTRLEPFAPEDAAETVRTARARLNEPLRVAIAGRVKAGKSTMLNAIIGQAAAATDAAECTKAVTWYVDGTAYLAWVRRPDGERRQVPYRRTDIAATVDLDGEDLASIDRVEVEFPSAHLRTMTLIDTPGTGSVSEQVSARTTDFLLPEHGDQGADVVVYLLRHVHERDADFVEAFTDPAVAPIGAARSIAVLSRADEIGNGRGDSLRVAQRIARRYAAHPALRTRVADVIPVAGLMAFTAATLTEAEFGQLRQLVGLSQLDLGHLVVSADRFLGESDRAPIGVDRRRSLLDRFGLFGVRLATSLIRMGVCDSAGSLARELELRSGIDPLRQILLEQFATRAEVLKAARAVDLVAALISRGQIDDVDIRRELERVIAGSYELAELRCLSEVLGTESDELGLGEPTRGDALAALGNEGGLPWQRLRADPAAPPAELIARAQQRVETFRSASMAPFRTRAAAEILGLAVRSMEAVHFELDQADAGEAAT